MIAGTATAPAWVAVLDAAKEWGVPAWEIADGSKVVWWLRWVTRRKLEIEIKEQLEKNG